MAINEKTVGFAIISISLSYYVFHASFVPWLLVNLPSWFFNYFHGFYQWLIEESLESLHQIAKESLLVIGTAIAMMIFSRR